MPPQDYTNLVNGLNQVANSIADNARTVSSLKDTLATFPGLAESISKKFEKAKTEMVGIVAAADDAQDAMKGMHDYTKTMSRDLSKTRMPREAVAALEAMVAASQRLIDRGILSQKEINRQKQRIGQLNATIHDLSANLDEALDDKKHQGLLNFVGRLNRETSVLSKNLGNVTMDTFSKSLMGVRKHLADVGFLKPRDMEKWVQMAQAGKNLRDFGKLKATATTAAGREKFVASRDAMVQRLQKAGMVGHGPMDYSRPETYRQLGYGRRFSEAAAGMEGKDPGEYTFMQKLIAGGYGGGAGTGLGGMMKALPGAGLVSGEGALGGIIGKLNPYLMVAEFLTDLWDVNAKMNKEVETALGKGGIFTGGMGGMQAMDIVRSNLTNLMPNRLGLNFERNLKMAQTVADMGLNIEDLTSLNLNKKRTGAYGGESEFAGGTFGQMQQIASVQGRILGMTDQQGVETTLKLAMQYQESLSDAQDFFVNIEKDSRAAGISGIKYVSILEGITDHFSRFNKAIDEVAGTMRMLSSSATETAEDLNQNLSAIYGVNRPQDKATNAFIIQQMGTAGQAGVAKNLQATLGMQANKIGSAMQGLGLAMSTQDIMADLMAPGGVANLQAKIPTMVAKARAGGANIADRDITQLYQLVEAAQATTEGIGLFSSGKNAIDIAGGLESTRLNKNPEIMRAMTLQTLKTIQGKAGKGMDVASMFFKGGADAGMLGNMLSGTFLGDPAFMEDMRQSMHSQALTRLQTSEQSPEMAARVYAMLQKSDPNLFKADPNLDKPTDAEMKAGITMQQKALTRWSMDRRTGGKMLFLLSDLAELFQNDTELQKGMAKADLQQQKGTDLGTARQIGGATQTIEEVIKNIIPALFNKVIGILEEIRGFFAHSSIFGTGINADEEKKAGDVMKQTDNAKLTADATDVVSRKLDALNDIKSQMVSNGEDTTSIDKQITDTSQLLSDIKDRDFGVNTGRGMKQAGDQIGIMANALVDLNKPITDLMGSMNVTATQATTGPTAGQYGFTLTDDQFEKVKNQILAFQSRGLLQDTQVTDATGKVTGHVIQTVINHTYNDADIKHYIEERNSMISSSETAGNGNADYYRAKAANAGPPR